MDLDKVQSDILLIAAGLPAFASLSAHAKTLRVKAYKNEFVPGEEGTLSWTQVFPLFFTRLDTAAPTSVSGSGKVMRWKYSFKIYIGRNNSCTDGILKLISDIADALNGEQIDTDDGLLTLQPGAVNFFSEGPGGIEIYTLMLGLV